MSCLAYSNPASKQRLDSEAVCPSGSDFINKAANIYNPVTGQNPVRIIEIMRIALIHHTEKSK
jgi:hypothetical protein